MLPLKSTGVGSYDSRLINSMRSWRYAAYQVDGEAVPVCTYLTFFYSQR